MKIALIVLSLLMGLGNTRYIIINNILYEMSNHEYSKIKKAYDINNTDIIKFEFNKDSCFISEAECIHIKNLTEKDREIWREYVVDIPILYLYEGKLVSKDHFHPSKLKSLNLYSKTEAIKRFGCKGLAPIFEVRLKDR